MKRARVMTALVCMALGLFSVATGLDPPEKMWEESYEWIRRFNDIRLYSDSLLVAAITPNVQAECMYMLNLEGDIIWQQGLEDPVSMNAVCQGSAETFVFAGCNGWVLNEMWDAALLLVKTDIEGEIEWQRIYDVSDQWEDGYDVAALPDGGYAVCGRVNGEGLYEGQAWILRTDANGDTLWTDVWGIYGSSYAAGIEYDDENNWLVVLVQGSSDSLPEWGPHLLFYDLDGNYLFGTSYPDIESWDVKGLCPTVDGGYAFVSEYGYNFLPVISGTGCQGDLLWSYDIYGFLAGDAHGIDRTVLDDGFLVTGFAVESTWVDTGNGINGARLVRFDGDGNELWDITEGSWGDEFCAAVQLPYGGYIAAGKTGYYDGYLVRYAPETGIEGPVSPGGGILRPVTPNPSSSVFNVSVNLPEAMDVRLEVHDTAGRRVELLVDGLLQSGAHEFSWDASGLSSGCYLVRLSGIGVSETVRCVLIR